MTSAGPLPTLSNAILVPSLDAANATFPAASDLPFADIAPPPGTAGLLSLAAQADVMASETNRSLSMAPLQQATCHSFASSSANGGVGTPALVDSCAPTPQRG